LRRKHRRTQRRTPQSVVHCFYQPTNRFGICSISICTHDRSFGLYREPSTCCLENLPRAGLYPSAQSSLSATQVARARRVQSRDYEERQDALDACHQVGLNILLLHAKVDNSRYYWFRLMIVSLIWAIYDFSAYSFSIYSSAWISIILGDSAPLWKSFGWNTIINLFYIPGAIGGAFLSDAIGAREALALGVALQGIVGFIMAGCYALLDTSAHVAGFVVVYGYVKPESRSLVYSYLR